MTLENEEGFSVTEEAGAVVGILEDIGDQSALFAFNTVLEEVHTHQEGRAVPFSGKLLELAAQAETLAWEVAGMMSGFSLPDRSVTDEPVRSAPAVSVLNPGSPSLPLGGAAED